MQGNNQFFAVFGSGGSSSSGGGGVSGSGTNNYVAKWTPDGSTIGDSIIQDNGSELGLNCTPDLGNGVRIEIPTTAIWSNALFTYHPDGRSGSNYTTIHSLSRNSNSGNTQEVAILGQVIPTTFQNSVQYVGLKGLLGNNNTNDHLGEHCGILGSSDQSGKDVKGVVGTIANGKSAIGVYGYLIDDATHSVDNFTGVQGTANIDNTSVSGSAYGVVGSVTIADVTNLPTQNAGGSFGATMSANADAGTYTMTALQSTGVRTTAFAGVLETAYSLKVGANTETFGTITNKYGIYQEGADDLNYFVANTGIGVTPLNSEAILSVEDTRTSQSLPAIFGFNNSSIYGVGVQGDVGNLVSNTSITQITEGMVGVGGQVINNNSEGTDYGVYGSVNSSSNNHLDLYGVKGRVLYSGTTSTRNITGGAFESNVNGATAQVLNSFGIDVDCVTTNTATIGTHYGMRVQMRSQTGTPSITTSYGIYLDSSNANYVSGTSSLFGIYQNGASALNYLQGNLRVDGQIWSEQGTTITVSANASTFNGNNGNSQKLDLASATGDITLTFTNLQAGGTYFIPVIQKSSSPVNIGTYVISGGTVKFPSGTAPTTSTGASAIDTLVVYYDGTDCLINFSQNYS